MIEWGYAPLIAVVIVFALLLITSVVMVSEGAGRMRENPTKGHLLFWPGGLVFGATIAGALGGMVHELSLPAILGIALMASGLMWFVTRQIHRIV